MFSILCQETDMNSRTLFQVGKCVIGVLLCVSMVFCFLLQSSRVSASPKFSAEDKQRLLAYLDTYAVERFLSDPAIKPQLERMLGSEMYHLKKNIDVHGPVGLTSRMLFVSGNAPHKGGIERGFVGINLNNGTVCAGLFSGGKIKVYAKSIYYPHLPEAIRSWILATRAETKPNGEMPPNVELIDR